MATLEEVARKFEAKLVREQEELEESIETVESSLPHFFKGQLQVNTHDFLATVGKWSIPMGISRDILVSAVDALEKRGLLSYDSATCTTMYNPYQKP